MKRLLFAAALSLLLLAGCGKAIYPSGVIVNETRAFSGFNALSVADGLHVALNSVSGDESVEIEADDNIIGYIETFVSAGTLVVKVRDGIAIRRNSSIMITVNASSVNAISASGGASITCNDPVQSSGIAILLSGGSRLTGNFKATSADISLSGESRAEGVFRAGSITLALSGGSKCSIEGTAERLNAACSGGSKAEGLDLIIEDASLELSGGSSAKFTINRTIVINASGGSKLLYRGGAAVRSQSLTGGSSIGKL